MSVTLLEKIGHMFSSAKQKITQTLKKKATKILIPSCSHSHDHRRSYKSATVARRDVTQILNWLYLDHFFIDERKIGNGPIFFSNVTDG